MSELPGFTTASAAGPATAITPTGIDTVICVALTNLAGRVKPFHCSCDVWTKFIPVTVSVKVAPPGVHCEGFSEDNTGDGPPS